MHDDHTTNRRWLSPLALTGLLLAFIRIVGIAGDTDQPTVFIADLPALPWWLDLGFDLAVGTGLAATARALLFGPHGIQAHIAPERTSLLTAAIFLSLGGAAMSGVLAVAMGGAMLGAQITVLMAAIFAAAIAMLAVVTALMWIVGERIYTVLFERLVDRG